MNTNRWKNSFRRLVVGCAMLACWACEKDDDQLPQIDSVWFNMVSRPVERAVCAYPKQTLCLHGSGFGTLKRLIVNGEDINLNTLFVYESDRYITFKLPEEIRTEGDFIRVVTRYGMYDYPFVVRPLEEQPEITAFSATTLVAGYTLDIRGVNLGGAVEVWLPLTFGGRVQCEFDPSQENTDTEVHVLIPEGVTFATGQCEIVMDKYDEARDVAYTEKVYSASTDFMN